MLFFKKSFIHTPSIEIIPYISIQELIDDIKGNCSDEKDSNKALEESLTRAYSIRQFELDLYWKRATYFWAFIAVTFTAYFIVAFKADKPHIKLLVICMGFIFSLAWYLVNRGSTYWVTHWERIIDIIEEHLKKGIYKINLSPEFSFWNLSNHYPFSVSRINIKVSFFIFALWGGLLCDFISGNIVKGYNLIFPFIHFYWSEKDFDFKIFALITFTGIISRGLMFSKSGNGIKTKKGKKINSTFSFYKRQIKYDNGVK